MIALINVVITTIQPTNATIAPSKTPDNQGILWLRTPFPVSAKPTAKETTTPVNHAKILRILCEDPPVLTCFTAIYFSTSFQDSFYRMNILIYLVKYSLKMFLHHIVSKTSIPIR